MVEVEGTGLLLTLAGLMVAFAGFSALLMSVRQAVGARLSRFDQLLAKTLVTHLFLLTAGAILPPLLALYDIAEPWIWRLAALIYVVPLLIFLFTYPQRRRRITGSGLRLLPFAVYIVFDGAALIATLIYVWSGLPHAAPAYVTGLLISLATLAFAFVATLEVILRQPGDETPDDGSQI